MERTTVRLPSALVKRAKSKARDEGRTLTSLIEEGLRRVLSECGPAQQRVLPRVSSARGGFLPGIDLDNSAALAELDDLESPARFK
jgi:hypothetical protein